MDAKRFFPIAYDSRNHPKVRMLRMRGEGIKEYGRYIALLSMLYDGGNRIDATDPMALELMAYELDFESAEDVRQWLHLVARCGLIDPGALEEFGVIASSGVDEQLDFMATRVAAGKKGGRPRKGQQKKVPEKVDL